MQSILSHSWPAWQLDFGDDVGMTFKYIWKCPCFQISLPDWAEKLCSTGGKC